MGCINSKDISLMMDKINNSNRTEKRSSKNKLAFEKSKKYTTDSQFAPFYQLVMQNPKVNDLSQQEKQIYKQIMLHLMQSRFNSEGINKTCDLCYKLYKTGKFKDQYFWFLPFHILFFYAKTAVGQRTYKQNFLLEEEIQSALKKLAIKYPPTGKEQIYNSQQIKNFKADPLPDLFEGKEFSDIQQFYSLVQDLNVQSHKLKSKFQSLLEQILKVRGDLHSFKSGTKLPKQKGNKYAKSLIRISQKYFSKYIDFKKFRNQVNYNGSYQEYFQAWMNSNQQQIRQYKVVGQQDFQISQGDQFLYQGSSGKKINKFQTYDLLRAKCQFKTVEDIAQTLELFKKKEQQGKLQIVVIKNRLNIGTKDVLVNIKFHTIVCQVQLALAFDKSDNEFNHKLYELIRDPAGMILACLLSISCEDEEQLYFYRQLATSCDNQQDIKSFNFLLTTLQQFFPSNVLPQQYSTQYAMTKAYIQPICAPYKWNCIYQQFGKQFQYSFDEFSVKNGLIQGQGIDLIRLFYVIGQTNGDRISFQKQYFKKHCIYYDGVQEGDSFKGTYGMINSGFKSEPAGTFRIFYRD